VKAHQKQQLLHFCGAKTKRQDPPEKFILDQGRARSVSFRDLHDNQKHIEVGK